MSCKYLEEKPFKSALETLGSCDVSRNIEDSSLVNARYINHKLDAITNIQEGFFLVLFFVVALYNVIQKADRRQNEKKKLIKGSLFLNKVEVDLVLSIG